MSGSHLCIPRNETVQPPYFQNRIIIFCLQIPTLKYLWKIYIFPGSVCLLCCSHICGPILGIYKSLTDIWMFKLGLRPCNSSEKEYINRIFVAVRAAKNSAFQIADPRVEGRDDCGTVLRLQEICQLKGALRFNYRPWDHHPLESRRRQLSRNLIASCGVVGYFPGFWIIGWFF
jgi:hypothetical protein